jgi:hypothetical protein
LEKFFRDKLKLSHEFSSVGNYWEKGNQNEIDIVAINDEQKSILIAEVKRNKNKISIPLLEQKSQKLIEKKKGYTVSFTGFSLDNM